jgi:hypothetical protein
VSEANTVDLSHCAKYVSLGLVGDLAQDRGLCFIGLSKSELAIPHSAGEVLGLHRLPPNEESDPLSSTGAALTLRKGAWGA